MKKVTGIKYAFMKSKNILYEIVECIIVELFKMKFIKVGNAFN